MPLRNVLLNALIAKSRSLTERGCFLVAFECIFYLVDHLVLMSFHVLVVVHQFLFVIELILLLLQKILLVSVVLYLGYLVSFRVLDWSFHSMMIYLKVLIRNHQPELVRSWKSSNLDTISKTVTWKHMNLYRYFQLSLLKSKFVIMFRSQY